MNDAQMPKLLPCPFCGGEAKVYGPVGWYRRYGISHSCCEFYGGSGYFTLGANSEEQAIADWNLRADLCASGQQVRALALLEAARFIETMEQVDPPEPMTAEMLKAVAGAGLRDMAKRLAPLTPAPQPAGEAVVDALTKAKTILAAVGAHSGGMDYSRIITAVGRIDAALRAMKGDV